MERTLYRIGKALLVLSLALMMAAGAAFADGSGTDPFFKANDLFSKRDLKQLADIEGAEYIDVGSMPDLSITKAGVYVLYGSAKDTTVYVNVDMEEKVQLVLDGLEIVNSDYPCIYVVSADKVFITVANDSSLSVTDSFRAEGGIIADGVIYSRDDLVLNGIATLAVASTDIGIVCKDDLKITGGTYVIDSAYKAFEANDSIRIDDGTFILTAGTDAFQAENGTDDSKGFIYIRSGTFTIQAGDEGIFSGSALQIDGGTFDITAPNGLKAAAVQINGGTVNLSCESKGVIATEISSAYAPAVIFNGGNVNISTSGDAEKAVSSDGEIFRNGGTVTVNGEQISSFR